MLAKRQTAIILLLLTALLLPLSRPLFAARVNLVLSVTAGTPLNILTGLSTAASASNRTLANRLIIQMPHGTTGMGYVMDGIAPGVVPAASNAAHVTAELAPATATAPGGSYEDSAPEGIDISRIWVDVTVTGTVRVSYDIKN